MKYMGSKRRIAKEIIPIMLKDYKEGIVFYDLFCGGCNLIDKIPNHIPRVANDLNKYVIALFKELQKDDFIFPEHIGEEKYKHIQKNKQEYPDWLVGYAGFNLSFAAKFFGGYRRDNAGVRNYENEAQQNLKAQQNLIKYIDFYNANYDEVMLKDNSMIYCDIPYKNSTNYSNKDKFDYEKFYNWCIEKRKEGHKVFISEYYMPSDYFDCVWQKEITSSLTTDTGSKKGVEKLWVVKDK
jgi:DNA adenine methylase